MPMAVRYSAMKPIFLSLVRPDRISSPMTSRAAVTIPGFVSDISQLSRRQGAVTCPQGPLKRREPVRPHGRHDHSHFAPKIEAKTIPNPAIHMILGAFSWPAPCNYVFEPRAGAKGQACR